MIKEGWYVRCPLIDIQFPLDPRTFVTGKVTKVNRILQTAVVVFEDPFGYRSYYDFVPKTAEYSFSQICRCFINKNAVVKCRNHECVVISHLDHADGDKEYWLQDQRTKKYFKEYESNICAPFTSGESDPIIQLKNYEFQNPCWYLGRQVVQRTMNVLDNSIHGFKELAGCKIYLKAFQLDTIMRCLQTTPCRYMIADEVGLGKTIEACSILKIFMINHSSIKVLITVPGALLAQWKSEMLFKFNLYDGFGPNNNQICLKAFDQITKSDLYEKWGFIIVDEVHNYLHDDAQYNMIHALSKNSENVLLLSATPIQQRHEEYLKLLQLILPEKYDEMSLSTFSELVEKQTKIARLAHLILDDLDTITTELIPDAINNNVDIHEDEDIEDEVEEIIDQLEDLSDLINDKALEKMIENIDTDKDDLGIHDIQVIMSYVCDHYQLERNIIRSRRAVLGVYPDDEDGEFASRELDELGYDADDHVNYYERNAYQNLIRWVDDHQVKENTNFTQNIISPLLRSFCSSPWAYVKQVHCQKNVLDDDVIKSANRWLEEEQEAINNLADILDEPERHPSRLISLISKIDLSYSDCKIVMFTEFQETLEEYYMVFSSFFGENAVVRFDQGITTDQAEMNIYRFQTDPECTILICDRTGGEGRNLQIADVVVHIDLPWEINAIEQRIGRLDRMGRDVEKPVISLVPYLKNSFEEQFFAFWNRGLKVFEHSLSGLEIIMNELEREIRNALATDIENGLLEAVPRLIKETEKTREIVDREQVFDTAAQRYKPLYSQLNLLLHNYESNDNSLLARTMLGWSSLAGFIGHSKGKGRFIEFNADSFSVKSAQNTFLIPPNWTEYLAKKQNEMVIRVQRGIEEEKGKHQAHSSRAIIGTFSRDDAIKNDYVHFYAPGDEVFDCVVNNAMQSYNGRAAAFAVESNLNWRGFVYTYSIQPNESKLLENNVSPLAISMFRSYLASSVQTIFVSMGDSDAEPTLLQREYDRIVNRGYFNSGSGIEHLGRRGKKGDFLQIGKRFKASNLEWFKSQFPKEKWDKLVEQSALMAYKKAEKRFVKESKLREAKEMIDSLLSTAEATEKYYGNSPDLDLTELRRQYELIYKSIKAPEIILESASFIWLVKNG